MNIADNLIAEATRRVFRDLGDPQAINGARDARWRAPLWNALEEAGLTRAWVPDALGGAGASIEDGFDILRIAGEFAVSVPLAETLLAGWLLARAGIAVPKGPIAAVIEGAPVAFGRDCEHFVFLSGSRVGLVKRDDCSIREGSSIAGEPRDEIMLKGAPLEPAGVSADAFVLMGAAVRAMQMSGALSAILDRSAAYAKERVAFERPIGGFQAVQHNLARLAGETAAALAAAGSAADAVSNGPPFDDAVFLEVASAKIRVGEAAEAGAAIAHQVHGAIGFSREHVLHRYTQRLWAWRDDFGSESAWALRLGEAVARKGADALWPALAER